MKKLLSILALWILVAACVLAFAACGDDDGAETTKYSPNEDYKSAAAGLYSAGYGTQIRETDSGRIEVEAYNKSDMADFIEIFYCSKVEDAEELLAEGEEELEEFKKLNNGLTYECDMDGTMVWIGTTNAIKASANLENAPFDEKYISVSYSLNRDPAEVEEALLDAGYKVTNTVVDGVGVVTGFSEANVADMVSIQYCADEETAQATYEKLVEEYEELQDVMEEMGIEYDFEFGISGTVVWVGAPDAVEAARK